MIEAGLLWFFDKEVEPNLEAFPSRTVESFWVSGPQCLAESAGFRWALGPTLHGFGFMRGLGNVWAQHVNGHH